jgi:hypothetical protein
MNCTVTDNDSEPDDSETGGGIRHTGGNIRAGNTIIAGNRPENCAFEGDGHISSEGYNLTDSRVCGLHGQGDLMNSDPLLQELADNGGQTDTHAIAGTSPATDGGNPQGCSSVDGQVLDTDQRGFVRPVDGKGDGTIRCDIGAFEFDARPPTPTPTDSPTATPSPSTEPTATESPTATPTPDTAGHRTYLPVTLNSYAWSYLASVDLAMRD